ncbi:Mediator of RNA polymerase II transcription subunit 12 [Yarrowia sp. C11]|nr:Mediator of RNA polymerase II transcription subunit 12 [Yarrowia sp. C11]KAG5364621.1 Mediator of RNA polymerase II transcription subunit 12 [Yarrowia sp. E02]
MNSSAPSPGPSSRLYRSINSRDDLSQQRYVLRPPDDVHPLVDPSRIGESMYPDFYPWKRSADEEDARMVDNLQKGYAEPPSVPHESQSAKKSIASLLRIKSNMTALSCFIITAMHIRVDTCRITTPGTFKPPPRVTLTDHKREAWLKDLANPAVPLRKLSRTIPHGIRNKVLLDQCCAKRIAPSRAVWFARCVGANELRGLKRKGHHQMGNMSEANWLLEWTECVVDVLHKSSVTFLTAEGDAQSRQTAKQNFAYMVRLAMQLYYEDIVDKHAFLQWVVGLLSDENNTSKDTKTSAPQTTSSSTSASASSSSAAAAAHTGKLSSVEKLPVAILIVRTFWKALLGFPSLAKKLAQNLLTELTKLEADSHADKPHYQPTIKALSGLVDALFDAQPDAFVMPSKWVQLGSTFEAIVADSESTRVRNEALVISDTPKTRRNRNKQAVIISILDAARAPFHKTLFNQIVDTRADFGTIIQTILAWAVSDSRVSVERVFIASHLVSQLSEGVDGDAVPSHIVQFLLSVKSHRDVRIDDLYALVTELCVLDIFQPQDYVRSLISSGVLYISRLSEWANVQLDILGNLPLLAVPNSCQVQVRYMVRKVPKYASYNENELLERTDRALRVLLPGVFQAEDVVMTSDSDSTDIPYSEFTQNTRIIVAENLYTSLCAAVEKGYVPSTQEFAQYQLILENLHAWRLMCASIQLIVPKCSQTHLLYFLANATRYQWQAFACIADMPALVKVFMHQYRGLRKLRVSRELWDLVQFSAQQLPELKPELETLLKSSSSPQLSPISEVTPQTDSEATKDVNLPPALNDLLLHSSDVRASCKMLASYKDDSQFSNQLMSWLRDQEVSIQLLQTLVFLVVYECTSIEKIGDLFLQIHNLRDMSGGSRLLLSLIARDLTQEYALSTTEAFSLQFQRKLFADQHPRIYLRLVAQYLFEREVFQDPQWLDDVATFCKEVSVHHPALFSQLIVEPVIEPDNAVAASSLQQLLNHLLKLDLVSGTSLADDLLQLITHVTPFNMVLAQTQLRLLFAHRGRISKEPVSMDTSPELTISSATPNTDTTDEDVAVLFRVLSDPALVKVPPFFGDLFSELPGELKGRILARAETTFLTSPNFPRVGEDNIVSLLIELADSLADSVTEDVCKTQTFALSSGLQRLVEASVREPHPPGLAEGISMFLKIAMIHEKSLMASEDAEVTMLRNHVIEGLQALLDSPFVSTTPDLKATLQDTWTALKSELSEVTEPASSAPSKTGPTRDLLLYSTANDAFSEVTVRSFDLLEESNPTMGVNDAALNLALFNATIEKRM